MATDRRILQAAFKVVTRDIITLINRMAPIHIVAGIHLLIRTTHIDNTTRLLTLIH